VKVAALRESVRSARVRTANIMSCARDGFVGTGQLELIEGNDGDGDGVREKGNRRGLGASGRGMGNVNSAEMDEVTACW